MKRQIKSLQELKDLASNVDGCDCYIKLNGGFTSSKHITYNENKWYILHLIDDTEECCSDEGLSKNHILEALNKGALFLDD